MARTHDNHRHRVLCHSSLANCARDNQVKPNIGVRDERRHTTHTHTHTAPALDSTWRIINYECLPPPRDLLGFSCAFQLFFSLVLVLGRKPALWLANQPMIVLDHAEKLIQHSLG